MLYSRCLPLVLGLLSVWSATIDADVLAQSAPESAPGSQDELIITKHSNVTLGPAIDTSACGITKGCARIPGMCSGADCIHILTWQQDHKTKTVKFELAAKTTEPRPWIAVGFSDDLEMSNTSVVDCISGSPNPVNVTIQASYNPDHYNMVLEPNNELGLIPADSSWSFKDGFLICRFTKVLEVRGPQSYMIANLTKDYHIFLAEGNTQANGEKGIHTQIPFRSPKKVFMSQNINLNMGSGNLDRERAFVATHATLMIVSWMFLSSIAIVSARHFKSAWSSRLCGQKTWFQIHRIMIGLTFTLTTTALVFIFVAEKLEPLKNQELHPILGVIVASLMLINAVLGLLRPHPGTTHRPVFNWVHCLVGNGAHLIAMVSMYFGVIELSEKADIASWCRWIVVAFGAWRITTEIIMTGQKYYKKEDLQVAYVEMSSGSVEGIHTENKIYCFKTSMVVIYLIGVTALTITLLVGFLPVFVSGSD